MEIEYQNKEIESYEKKEYSPFGVEVDEIQKFDENHKKYKLIVQDILENWDKSTNNDVLLYFEVLRYLELIKITSSRDDIIIRIKKAVVPFIPSPESITRARRALNSIGIGLPTSKAVFLRRMRRQDSIRKYFS